MTAFQYDFNLLPLGQEMAMKHLRTFREFPPPQTAATYKLDAVMEKIRTSGDPSD
jgi:hypothetical protein